MCITLIVLLFWYAKQNSLILDEVHAIYTTPQDALEEPDLSGIPYITRDGEKPIETSPVTSGGGLSADVTAYSAIDSCHTGPDCLMASGKSAYVGAVACPRVIPLGTKVQIGSRLYTCEDRTARWVDGRFDIFMGYGTEAHAQALSFGRQRHTVLLSS